MGAEQNHLWPVTSYSAPGPPPFSGTATVVYSRERGDGMVMFDGAAAPPPGMVYQVWLMKDGVPVPSGSAIRDPHTVMIANIGRASALGLTVEPLGRAAGAAPGDMIGRVMLP